MSQTSFSIAYDGPAVESGSMDVRDLAPALLAVGQLFDAANAALNEERATVGVNVVATTQGSFEVVLNVVQSAGSQLVSFFSGDLVTAALQLRDLAFGVGGVSLIWLVKKLRGKEPEKIEHIDDERVRITVGSETFDIPIKLLRLYEDLSVRGALERVVKDPLDKEGIDTVEIRQEGNPVESVSAAESAYFRKPDIDEVVVKSVSTTAYSIVSLAFKQENKWRLHDGNAAISVSIVDSEFLQRVDANLISFAKGDILICEVEMIQRRVGDDLKAEYTVLRVIEHQPAPRQLDLAIDSADAAADDERMAQG